MSQNIIYSPWERTKRPWLCLMITSLLFSLLRLFSFVSAFLTSLIQLIFWLKFSAGKRMAEDMLGVGWGGQGQCRGVTKSQKQLSNFQLNKKQLLNFFFFFIQVKVAQLCFTLCDPVDYTVHGILQARILEWVAVPFCRGSSQPRDQILVSQAAGRFFTGWATREDCFYSKAIISANTLNINLVVVNLIVASNLYYCEKGFIMLLVM